MDINFVLSLSFPSIQILTFEHNRGFPKLLCYDSYLSDAPGLQ
jgi:hypothetical protein